MEREAGLCKQAQEKGLGARSESCPICHKNFVYKKKGPDPDIEGGKEVMLYVCANIGSFCPAQRVIFKNRDHLYNRLVKLGRFPKPTQKGIKISGEEREYPPEPERITLPKVEFNTPTKILCPACGRAYLWKSNENPPRYRCTTPGCFFTVPQTETQVKLMQRRRKQALSGMEGVKVTPEEEAEWERRAAAMPRITGKQPMSIKEFEERQKEAAAMQATTVEGAEAALGLKGKEKKEFEKNLEKIKKKAAELGVE